MALKKWAMYVFAGVGALLVVAIALQAVTGWADSDAQKAYDAGVAYSEKQGTDFYCTNLRTGKTTMDELIADDRLEEAQAIAAETLDTVNLILRVEADSQGHYAENPYFISGFWDNLTAACPDAFYKPEIAGRPGS